ncbi:hypothetical protein [Maledivibacter halophilus]|uniref:DUF340 domain-containing protein n=1 Tax=Maledivibacter halophilus TaxID=36842 RepID=A0A1T5IKZ1_9FIRM|nr:hypothetical protein [Maledivibacter halophilus]SKC39805.1 hypothetical protein SAMN02194393_00504 [Maledivibacter halophilus]
MLSKTLRQIKVMIIVGLIILIGQKIGYGISVFKAIPGVLIVLTIAIIALKIKELTPKLKFPAFAWAVLIALLLSMPFMPTAKIFLQYTDEVNFLGTATPILALAGISVGNKIPQIKEMSWKVFIVAIVVFIGTYFGSALVANTVLKIQGII